MQSPELFLLPDYDHITDTPSVEEGVDTAMVACRLGSCVVGSACETWNNCLGTDDDNRN